MLSHAESPLSLRRLQEGDLADLAALEQEIFSENAWSVDNIASALKSENDVYLGKFLKQELVGALCYRLLAPEAELLTIGVKSDFRGQGIAAELLNTMHQELVAKQVETVFLEVREQNAPAIWLYKKYGYKAIGKRRNYYRFPVDNALVMRKKFREGLPVGAEVLS